MGDSVILRGRFKRAADARQAVCAGLTISQSLLLRAEEVIQ